MAENSGHCTAPVVPPVVPGSLLSNDKAEKCRPEEEKENGRPARVTRRSQPSTRRSIWGDFGAERSHGQTVGTEN